jgi:DNA-binding NtrC family response regulator
VVVPDLARELPFGLATSAREMGIRSAMSTPLRVERKRVGASAGPAIPTVRGLAGVLYVDSTSAATFGEDDGHFLDVLADCAVLALRATRMTEALRAAEAQAAQASAQAGTPARRAATRRARDLPPDDDAPVRPIEGLVTRDPGLRAVLRLVERVAPTDASVLVRGESGTGKELIARALHAHGRRARGPFVALDCGAIPETLVQHELFGHEAGAFTGAGESKAGLLERAHGGTLFLDEVGEMPPSMQAALLRVVQEGEVRRIGADRPRAVDVRLVAATHRDLKAMVERGEFRQDLLFRLAVVELRLPPLRERPGDVPLLVEHLLARLRAQDERARTVEDDALARLEEHGWPGNVRELENVVRASALMAAGPTITLADVDRALGQVTPPARAGAVAGGAASFEGTMEEVERRAIADRLERFAWNQVQAAKSLGMDRNTLHRKVVRYGIVRGRA